MLRAALDYIRTEAWPRRRRILWSSECFIAVLVSVAFGLFGDDLAIGDATTGNVMVVILAYAAIAFGFCLAGLTVALTLPDRQFALELVKDPNNAEGRSDASNSVTGTAYSNLIFVFSWTAVAHWLTIVGAFVLLVAAGPDAHLVGQSASAGHEAVIAALFGVCTYAVLQFLTTVITLSQVGAAYVGILRNSAQNGS